MTDVEMLAKRIRELETELDTLRRASRVFLSRIDHITTDDFQRGVEHDEREALRAVLNHLDIVER